MTRDGYLTEWVIVISGGGRGKKDIYGEGGEEGLVEGDEKLKEMGSQVSSGGSRWTRGK